MVNHFISASCHDERCSHTIPSSQHGNGYDNCGAPAAHKIGEEIPHDDLEPHTPWTLGVPLLHTLSWGFGSGCLVQKEGSNT